MLKGITNLLDVRGGGNLRLGEVLLNAVQAAGSQGRWVLRYNTGNNAMDFRSLALVRELHEGDRGPIYKVTLYTLWAEREGVQYMSVDLGRCLDHLASNYPEEARARGWWLNEYSTDPEPAYTAASAAISNDKES